MNTSQVKWDRRFLELAEHVSKWSKDPSTKCGAVISKGNRVLSLGYNGLPVGIPDTDEILNTREVKLEMVLHAEVNAVLHAKQDLAGCTLAVFPFPPCARCAAVIIQARITRVVTKRPNPELAARWEISLQHSMRMFEEAGVEIIYVEE